MRMKRSAHVGPFLAASACLVLATGALAAVEAPLPDALGTYQDSVSGPIVNSFGVDLSSWGGTVDDLGITWEGVVTQTLYEAPGGIPVAVLGYIQVEIPYPGGGWFAGGAIGLDNSSLGGTFGLTFVAGTRDPSFVLEAPITVTVIIGFDPPGGPFPVTSYGSIELTRFDLVLDGVLPEEGSTWGEVKVLFR